MAVENQSKDICISTAEEFLNLQEEYILDEFAGYYIVDKTNNSRTIYNGCKKITFGVVGYNDIDNGYCYIVDENEKIKEYKTYRDFITFISNLYMFCA